jgi:hypothetical protein
LFTQQAPHAGPRVHSFCTAAESHTEPRGQVLDLFSPSMPNPDITIALARRTRCAAKFQLCLHEQLHLAAAAHPVPQFLFQSLPCKSLVLGSGHHIDIYPSEDLVRFGSRGLAKKWAFQDRHAPLSISSPIRHYCRDVAFSLHGFC